MQTLNTYVCRGCRQYLNDTKKDLVPEAGVNSITLNQHLPITSDRYKEF